jgi:hypothetical protein
MTYTSAPDIKNQLYNQYAYDNYEYKTNQQEVVQVDGITTDNSQSHNTYDVSNAVADYSYEN